MTELRGCSGYKGCSLPAGELHDCCRWSGAGEMRQTPFPAVCVRVFACSCGRVGYAMNTPGCEAEEAVVMQPGGGVGNDLAVVLRVRRYSQADRAERIGGFSRRIQRCFMASEFISTIKDLTAGTVGGCAGIVIGHVSLKCTNHSATSPHAR